MIATALRLSTLAALTNGGPEPWPTIAGPYVYDSRRDDISDLAGGERRPIIIVRTNEDDRQFGNGRQQGRTIELAFEFSVVTMTRREMENGEEIEEPLTVPSDGGTEAMLNMLEHQIEGALTSDSQWGIWWRSLWTADDMVSAPVYVNSPEGPIRLAARDMIVRIKNVRPECFPKAVIDGDAVPGPVWTPPLPAVFARIAALAGDSSLKFYAAAIQASLTAANTVGGYAAPELRSIWLTVPHAAPPPAGEPDTPQLEAEIYGDLPPLP